ncbi:MAG: arsenate reductase [Rhodobacteraceae bacterium]|jgi:arsenate reductase-like glutaredoxin family protein|nr:arsenate reductase [Paracoccaceae bacterium]
MILYGLKTCDTCRKALKSLDESEFRDVRRDGVPQDVLKSAYDAFGEALINRKSTTWRALSEAERDKPVLDLLAEHPTLMKRPLIDTGRDTGARLYLGWDKTVQAALLT